MSKHKNKKMIKELEVVPYQLCPKCNGDGVVLVQNWYGSPINVSSSGTQICNVCNGAGIIPMHIVSI